MGGAFSVGIVLFSCFSCLRTPRLRALYNGN
jgi:hypothetical protein